MSRWVAPAILLGTISFCLGVATTFTGGNTGANSNSRTSRVDRVERLDLGAATDNAQTRPPQRDLRAE